MLKNVVRFLFFVLFFLLFFFFFLELNLRKVQKSAQFMAYTNNQIEKRQNLSPCFSSNFSRRHRHHLHPVVLSLSPSSPTVMLKWQEKLLELYSRWKSHCLHWIEQAALKKEEDEAAQGAHKTDIIHEVEGKHSINLNSKVQQQQQQWQRSMRICHTISRVDLWFVDETNGKCKRFPSILLCVSLFLLNPIWTYRITFLKCKITI